MSAKVLMDAEEHRKRIVALPGARAWPLVGRAGLLDLLRGLLTGPEARGAVLAGPAGAGRTTLGQACLRMAAEDGMATAAVAGTRAAEPVAFGAVAPLLDALPPSPAAAAESVDLIRRSLAARVEAAGGDRLLLLADDAHLLDGASATLVHQLATSGTAIVVATVRSGSPCPDPILALWKDGPAERVDLHPLDPATTAEVLATVLDGPVDPAAVARLVDRCGGSAVYLRELVVGALADGSLADDDGVWRLGADPPPPPALVDLVVAELAPLDHDARALMELVAHGEPLGQATLTALSRPGVAEDLEGRGLLRASLDGGHLQVRLAHPLHGEVVRALTPALRTQAIARALADTAERETGADGGVDPVRLATWRLTAGQGEPDMLLEGATAAHRRHDPQLAERLARAAEAAGAGFDAALLAARAAGDQGRPRAAYAELAELAERAVDDAERARAAIARFELTAGRPEPGDSALVEALSGLTDPAWRARLAARRLVGFLESEGPAATLVAASALLTTVDDTDARAVAQLVSADALVRTGRLDDAAATVARASDAAASWQTAVTRCTVLRHAGRLQEATEVIAGHHARAVAAGASEAQAVFAGLDAAMVADRGRPREALARAREAAAVHRRLDLPNLLRRDLAAAALAHALAGDVDPATDTLAELDTLDGGASATDDVDVAQARAWVEAAAGHLPAACQHLHTAAARAEQIGDAVGAASALHALARLGRAEEAVPGLAAVATRIDGDLGPARHVHAAGVAAGDAEALESVSLAFEDMGADLLAAEAAADAAVVHRRSGRARAATAAARRAGELVEVADNPVTPALHAVETRAVLTTAERETAVLAAAGRANKEIAEQLHLSPRTVENRLQRVYDKLGIAGRNELGDVLAPAC